MLNPASPYGLYSPLIGMYRGYKARNRRLEELNEATPEVLSQSRAALAIVDFRDFDSLDVLKELYDYLAFKFALLDRVIRARKINRSHFFSLNLDYGHQYYLDSLSGQKFIVLRALERLERRTADVLYEERKWFKWVRQCQDTEEAQRENEKKKIKQGAALFRRHQKELHLREQESKTKEALKRQDAELDKIFNVRLSIEAEEEAERKWDPIEDIVEDQRGTYIELINSFLFISQPTLDMSSCGREPCQPEASASSEGAVIRNASGRAMPEKKASTKEPAKVMFDKPRHEPAAAIQRRLREGVNLSYSGGIHIAGTIDTPVELKDRTAPIPPGEIDQLLKELAEIKLPLFCRLLLSHATLLPAALRAANVGAFLQDREVGDTDLRDLCLRMEDPALEEIRDACADLGREDEEDDKDEESVDEDEDDEQENKSRRTQERLGFPRSRRGIIPEKWSSEQEMQMKKQKEKLPQAFIDSGLHEALKLCRNWKEFWELNILSIFHYFLAANWLRWKGDHTRQQLLQYGLIPYAQYTGAHEASSNHQTGSRGQQYRRAHAVVEHRNFMCCNIERNNPASRRFCQYLSTQSNLVVVLIRDTKTGRILVKPPEGQYWLRRSKAGLGRASKNEWDLQLEMGPKFFEEVQKDREWHFPLTIIVISTYGTWKLAHRCCDLNDGYEPAAYILKTLARGSGTSRTRNAKEGEETLWDELQRGKSQFIDMDRQAVSEDQHEDLFYNEADALEDTILFPEEHGKTQSLFKPSANAVNELENSRPNWWRFINDLDTDEETDPSDEDDEDDQVRKVFGAHDQRAGLVSAHRD
ncbi:MAG: hypothetical protein Q9222_000038 [Ikaeria aurantiellina]